MGNGTGNGSRRPRCPYTTGSLHDAMVGCPGYERSILSFAGLQHGRGVPDQPTCHHLAAERSGRGYVGACHHPEVAWVVADPARMAAERDRSPFEGAVHREAG